MTAASETPQPEPGYTLRVLPPPEGPFDREAALRFLSWEHAAYLEIVGHAHAVGVADKHLRDGLAALSDDVQTLTRAAAHVLETGEPAVVAEDRDWRCDLDRPGALQNLAALATSEQAIFQGEETLLEGPGFEAYERLGAHLRRRLAEDREAAR